MSVQSKRRVLNVLNLATPCADVQSSRKEVLADENMQSDKNNFVVSVKEGIIPAEDERSLTGPLPEHVRGDPAYQPPVKESQVTIS